MSIKNLFPALALASLLCACGNSEADKTKPGQDSLVENRDSGLRVVSYYANKSDTSTKTKELRYFSNGEKQEILFSAGKMNGEWKKWTAKGKLKASGTYKDGVEQGPLKFYNADGVLQQEIVYADGKKTNIKRNYYPTGELGMEQYSLPDGQDTLQIFYHKNGKVNARARIKDGVEYESTTWYDDGTLWDKTKDGHFTEWYRNGKKKQEGKVNERKLQDGVWKYWNEDGTPRKDTVWVKGEKK